jgi:hypothetical protein
MSDPSQHPLAGPLHAAAAGLDASQAAARLIIAHATWINRADFRDQFIRHATHPATGARHATIDWPAAITALDTGQLPCSGSENRILRLAASIADGIPVSLRDTLTSLDNTNIAHVITAILHASGRRQHHHNPPPGARK